MRHEEAISSGREVGRFQGLGREQARTESLGRRESPSHRRIQSPQFQDVDVLFVLEGELMIELKDGRRIAMPAATSFQAGDDQENPHLAYSETGAKVFIID